MKKINLHGMKMTGIKKASSETKGLRGYYSGEYVQLNYDKATGAVWCDYFYSLGQNSWNAYNDENVINCGNISEPATMQDIADAVYMAVNA